MIPPLAAIMAAPTTSPATNGVVCDVRERAGSQ